MRIGKPFYAYIPSHVLANESPCRGIIPFPFPCTLCAYEVKEIEAQQLVVWGKGHLMLRRRMIR
jgi:hypothetical protein